MVSLNRNVTLSECHPLEARHSPFGYTHSVLTFYTVVPVSPSRPLLYARQISRSRQFLRTMPPVVASPVCSAAGTGRKPHLG